MVVIIINSINNENIINNINNNNNNNINININIMY